MTKLPTASRRLLGALGGVALTTALAVGMAGTPASAAEGTVRGAGSPNAIAGSYLVVLKDAGLSAQGVTTSAAGLANRYGGAVAATFTSALRGFSATMSERAARRLAADPAVAWVEQDMVMHLTDTQTNPPSWGLDRIDQRNLPLSSSYTFPTTASNVHAYIIDTGIRFTHTTFGGRATSGRDTVDEDNDATDCHGHGTHVAGTVGGSQYGVAKAVQLVGIRVLNCQGSGTTTDIVQGIDWVTQNGIRPAVANMSLGGGINTTLDNAVANSINSGVTYAIAAGNSNQDACNFSPARTPAAITLGATDINDNRASFSNFGTCVDIFGPGVNITSSWMTSDTATNTISGTSMATPHAAGVAALILAANPSFTPQQVRDRMVADSTTGVVVNAGTGSPNRLLFVNNGATTPPPSTTVFFDNFETSLGWTTNPLGTDTAVTGQWERGDPEQTTSTITLQLGTTVSGVNDLVTARLAGASAGANDVDGGVTTSQSPAITLPSTGTLTLTFSWYLAHLNNATSADFFRVSVVNSSGTATQVFNQAGAAVNRAGAWATATVNLTGFAGQTIRLRVQAADADTASLIEAGVDDVRISQS
jgi:subtilisin family serine protease